MTTVSSLQTRQDQHHPQRTPDEVKPVSYHVYNPCGQHQIAIVAAQGKAPRLDIKKDAKGMVVVPGATVLEVTSAKELLANIAAGQTHRHVASTQVCSRKR